MRTKNAFLRALGALGLVVIAASIAACGGGGGGGGSTSSTTSGSSSGSSGSSSSSAVSNQATVNLASGAINMLTVSVTVCAPGTSTCQTIDNIQVDTMSFGLRLVSTAASQVLGSLPHQTTDGGTVNQMAECQTFADGTFTWGSVRTADIKIAGETASSIPVHILGDLASSTRPSGCSGTRDGDSVSALGVNGILGIGVKPYDCGSNCVSSSSNGFYFVCPNGTSCTGTAATLAQQVVNPVAKFVSDNTGVILTMPSVGTNGASSASGTLTFGIGTQSNNAKPSTVTTYGTDSSGNVNAVSTFISGTGAAFFDSGSNGYFFDDSSLTSTECLSNNWYCPSQTTTRVVTISNASGTSQSGTVTMSFGNAQTLFNTGNIAFNDVAGPFTSGFADFGMPFFYGKTIYFGYDTATAGTGTQSPYVAY